MKVSRPALHVTEDDRLQTRLVDRNDAGLEHAKLPGIGLDAHDVIAHFGEAGCRDEADVTSP